MSCVTSKRYAQITLLPMFMTKNIRKTVKWKVTKRVGMCDKKHGYITEVLYDSIDIGECTTQQCGSMIVFDVSFTAVHMKPKVADLVVCTIKQIIPTGFFVATNHLKILVPKCRLPSYVKINGCESVDIDETKLRLGDKVNVEIYAVDYKNSGFRVLGLLCDSQTAYKFKPSAVEVKKDDQLSDDDIEDDFFFGI